jgi:hypothetical protein
MLVLAARVEMKSFFLLFSNSSFRLSSSSALGLFPMSMLSREERMVLNFYRNLLLEQVMAALESKSGGKAWASSAGCLCMKDTLI